MSYARFYNKMPFEIKMRAIWIAGNPPIIVKPGEIIEGPYDFLSQYAFLQFIPVDFHRVESIIQGPDYVYKDELLPQNNNVNVISVTNEEERNGQDIEKNKDEEIKKNEDVDVEKSTTETNVTKTELPFDPTSVNWLGVKIDQLELAAKVLNIQTSHLKDVKPKEKKWALVKLIKDATINKQ